MNIFYCGLQYDKYDKRRGLSYEHENFYLSLANYPGVKVSYFPFDEILTKGKRRWNEELLSAAKAEKPDLIFVFMLSDELKESTLDELRKFATTVAWFADDHWRFHNYSRFWARRFSWVITTYSLAVDWYRRVGVKNVIRSQWAANTRIYKPCEKMPPDSERPDAVFVGGWSKPRQKILDALERAGIAVEAYGGGFRGGRVSREEMTRLFSAAKINLALNPPPGYFNKNSLGRLLFRRSLDKIVPDFHVFRNFRSFLSRGIPQIKGRHFEIPACRGFVMTSRADDIENYYTPDKEMVFYDSPSDLADKIKYYLSHEKEREAIAKAGYERTIREHTYEKRFRELFKEIGLKF